MKTAELTGALLDYWVARAEGTPAAFLTVGAAGEATWGYNLTGGKVHVRYSTDWAQGGPLIEKYGLAVVGGCDPFWYSMPSSDEVYVGGEDPSSTPLVAICRAVVRAKFGDEVPE